MKFQTTAKKYLGHLTCADFFKLNQRSGRLDKDNQAYPFGVDVGICRVESVSKFVQALQRETCVIMINLCQTTFLKNVSTVPLDHRLLVSVLSLEHYRCGGPQRLPPNPRDKGQIEESWPGPLILTGRNRSSIPCPGFFGCFASLVLLTSTPHRPLFLIYFEHARIFS